MHTMVFKIGLSPSKNVGFICLNESALKMMKDINKSFYLLPKRLFSFLRYLNFCPSFFSHVEKWLDKKAKVNFKISDVINWETDYNAHITQYLKK